MMVSRRHKLAHSIATTLCLSFVGAQAAYADNSGITIIEQGQNPWLEEETQIIVTEVPAHEARKTQVKPKKHKPTQKPPRKTVKKASKKPPVKAKRAKIVSACRQPYVVQPTNPVIETELNECLAAKNTLSAEKANTASRERALLVRIDAISKKMDTLEQQLADEISANNQLQKQLNTSRKDLSSSRAHIKSLHAAASTSRAGAHAATQQLQQLHQELAKQKQAQAGLKKSSSILMDGNLQLTSQLANALSKLDAFRVHATAIKSNLQNLQQENANLKALTARLGAQNQALLAKTDTLSSELKTVQSHAKLLHKDQSALRKENQNLQQRLIELAANNAPPVKTDPNEESVRQWIAEYLTQYADNSEAGYQFDISPEYQLVAGENQTYTATWKQFDLKLDDHTVKLSPVQLVIYPPIGEKGSSAASQRQFSANIGEKITVSNEQSNTVANIHIGKQNFTGIWDSQYSLATAQAGILQNIQVDIGNQPKVATITSFSYQSNSQVDAKQNWKSPGSIALAGVSIELDGQQVTLDEYSVSMDMAGTQFGALAKLSKSFANLNADAQSSEQTTAGDPATADQKAAALLEELFSYFDSYSYQAKLNNFKWQMLIPNSPEPMVLGAVEQVISNGKGSSGQNGSVFEQDIQLNGLKLPPSTTPGNFPITDLYLSFSANQIPKGLIKQILSPAFQENPGVLLSSLEASETGLFFSGSARNQDIAEINWKSHGLINSKVEENLTGTLTFSVRGIPEIKAVLANSLSGEEKLKAEAALTMIDLLGQEQQIDGKTFDVYNFKLDSQQRYFLNGADITALVKSVKARNQKPATKGQTAPAESTAPHTK